MYATKDESTDFVSLVRQLLETEDFSKVKTRQFLFYKLQYPAVIRWQSPSATFLKSLDKKDQRLLRKQKAFFVIDCSWEGYNPIGTEYPFFKILYRDCQDLGIDPSVIIYVSSNLKDEENLVKWNNDHGIDKSINVISYNRFTFTTLYNLQREVNTELSLDPYHSLAVNEKMFKELYKGKLFTSLSRVYRKWRTISQYVLSTQEFSQYGLLSQNRGGPTNIKGANINKEKFLDWHQNLPLSIDRSDFETNWATENYGQLFNQTVFHICNETFQDNENNSSFFYSEKTFKAMKVFQPFVIWGQPGANTFLKTMGFKTYDDWFDLSFDTVEDNYTRLEMLIKSVSDACKELMSLPRDKQIEWRFKSKDVLLHNYTTLLNREWDKDKIRNFLMNLESSHLVI